LKRSQALAVLALSLLLAAAIPVQQASAQSAYTEKLNVFIAGGNSLWYFTFTGVNGSSRLSGLESTPGLSWYNITAVRTTGWSSDFQAFGPNGYNVFPVSSPPGEGALLTVGSDSYADASAAAAKVGAWLLTQFISSGNGSGTYSFYAPLTFSTIAPKTLLTLLPTGEGGFTNAIVPSSFDTTQSPLVILEGTKASSGFQHTLVVGSISATALDGSFRPNVLDIYGTTITSLQASNHSSSSVLQIRVLDGLIKSSDRATIMNDTTAFDSSYTLSLAPAQKITQLNATVLQQPAPLLAYRTVSRGILHTGQKLQVTVTLTNLSPTLAYTNITFADNWWNSTEDFTLQGAKNSTTFPAKIPADQSATPVYDLEYTGTASGTVTIPASVLDYYYQLGTSIFKGETVLNPITLYLGKGGPVVYSYVVPQGGFSKTVGQPQTLQVDAVNIGNQSASSVVVAGQSISGLAANTTARITVTQAAASIAQRNYTQAYTTSYQDLEGDHLTSETNVLSVVFSHSSMNLGLATLELTETSAPYKSGTGTNLTLAFVASNLGNANVTSFSSQLALPKGLTCGTIKGNGTTCSAGMISINHPTITSQKSLDSFVMFNVTAPENFIIAPVPFHATTSGFQVQGTSNPLGIPTGFSVDKAFSPSALFGGMSSTVSLVSANGGPYTIYNVTFGSTVDSFDSLSSTVVTSKTASAIAPGSNSTLTYLAVALPSQGNFSSTTSTASFYFGGVVYTMSFPGPTVSIYQPLTVTITTSPAATTEGKPFTMSILISNPSGVPVSNVLYTLPIPPGLTLTQLQGMSIVGKNITVQAATLAAHGSLNASATAEAGSGITVPFAGSTLTFNYGGVTVSGSVPSGGIAIGENVTTRYVLPIALVVLVLLAAVYYIRKISVPSVPTSRQ
jgi:hypothetical protein